MDIISRRPEFVIYVVDEDSGQRNSTREVLSGARFQTEGFSSPKDALERIKSAPPHIVVVSTHVDLIDKIRALSPDIEILYMTIRRDLGVEALRRGAFCYIEKPLGNPAELVSMADRVMENIYLKMENEQILEELKTQSSVPVEIGPFVENISKIVQSEEVIQETLNYISAQNKNVPALYLKYLPVYQSLAVTASAQIPFEGIKTVGIKLDKHDPRDVPGLLSAPGTFSELREMMREVFTCNAFYAKPFRSGGQALGIVVVFLEPNDLQKKVINSALGVGEIAHDATILTVKLGEQSIRDPLTGLYNRRHFNEKIDDEVNRSRRTHYPLSLIQLEVDHFRNYNDSNGMNMGDVVLKSIAHILLKTSRKIDVVARLGSGEFAILCPHTPAFGAAIKAEKIRLTIENTKFPYGEKQQLGKITVSLGVSEYPTIVKNSDFLMRSASDALFKVKQGGRNKVCLAEAPAGFKADFEPLKVPGFKPLIDESAPV